jgi:hypothetical protein
MIDGVHAVVHTRDAEAVYFLLRRHSGLRVFPHRWVAASSLGHN